jgi:glycine cleavage system H protein
MKIDQCTKKDLYYTKDHEWIEFKGARAYTGICAFKLTGFKEVQKISFKEPSGFKKQGDIIATIRYNDYQIDAHMPVDGEIIALNDALIRENYYDLLQNAENVWMALIVPSHPSQRKHLLLPREYEMIGKKNSPNN